MRWKVCPQNKNYQISDTGLCKSTQARFEGKYLKPSRNGFSDSYVLCEKYGKKAYRIQHLVYTAFVGEIPKGYIVFNKDGDLHNNNLENLDIMPRRDKIFYFAPRTRNLLKTTGKNKYTFVINGKTYKSSLDVIKDYPVFGTKQNVCQQADRWLNGRMPRGTKWNPKGFTIRGVLIWATKNKTTNSKKLRMEKIQEKYNLKKTTE